MSDTAKDLLSGAAGGVAQVLLGEWNVAASFWTQRL